MGLGISIAGLGAYLPPATITNRDLQALVQTSDDWIVSRTGIRSRHVAGPHQATSDLALAAARDALAQARLSPRDIDLILVATSTPDSPVPPTACRLQATLGADSAVAMDVVAACSGFLFATHTATGLLRAGMHRNALVVGAETLTRFTDYSDRSTCVLFGDGAGAAILRPDGYLDLLHSSIHSDGAGADLIQIPGGGSRHPASSATIAERMHFLRLKGPEVFRRAVGAMSASVRAALDSLRLLPADIAWLIPHQANHRITLAVADELGFPMDRVIADMADVGNTSAASLPIALSRLQKSGRIQRGDRIMLVGFGAGLTWGCQVFICNTDPTARA
ncbi:MAG: ketoacyl-ACP synthase III [Phycisphaerales bacterium]|nr:ketoacyl-ACP synthase III [Phycisphaerales bacterium]